MTIQSKSISLLQDELTLERTNSVWYETLASAADVADRHGAKAFFKHGSKDERGHAKRIQDFLVDVDAPPVFEEIPAIPVVDGSNYVGMFQLALQREKVTTAALNALWAAVMDAGDAQAVAFIQNGGKDWPGFLLEQIEEEEQLQDYISRIQPLDAAGLELFDKELKKKYK
jgi:ferritin